MSDTKVIEISIDKIHSSPWQPRQNFDEEKMKELADSFIAKGIIAPIVVRKDKNTPEEYEIIAGERRLRAWKIIGKENIPAIVKDVDDFTAREMSGVENLQREDLADIEKEKFFHDLWEDGFKAGRYASNIDMGRQIGTSGSHVSHMLNAYKDRNSLKTVDIAGGISTIALIRTRSIRNLPDVRENLLKIRFEQPDKISYLELHGVVQAIKYITPAQQSEIVEMLGTDKLQAKDVPQYVETLKASPPDIQEKLINQEITPEEAKTVNIFKTPEQRTQVLKESG